MPKLIILSDLYGFEEATWLEYYTNVLGSKFEIQLLDSCLLGEVTKTNELDVHHQFINVGIECAVENLLRMVENPSIILAFSIGGTIAWKAVLKGLNISYLIAVSSTRLRKEMKKPECKIELIYGEKDLDRPNADWNKVMELKPHIFNGYHHNMYQHQMVANQICNKLIAGIYE